MGASGFVLGNALRDARLALGLSLSAAADGILPRAQLADIESGATVTDDEIRRALFARLDLASDGRPRSESQRVRANLESCIRTGDWERATAELARLPAADDLHGLYSGLVIERHGDLGDASRSLDRWRQRQHVGSVSWTRASTALCRCLRDAGRIQDAIVTGEEALRELNGAIDADVEIQAELAATLAGAYCESGDLERALDLTAPPAAELDPTPWSEVSRCWARAIALHVAGRSDEARDTAFAGLLILRRLDRPLTLARLQNVAAWLAMQAEHFDLQQLDAMLQESELAVRTDDTNRSLATLLTTQAELAARKGDEEAARARLCEAQALMLTDDAGDRARVLAACAQVYASLHDVEEAVRLLLLARQLLEDSGARRSAAATWRQMADIYTSLQQPDLALACMQAAMDLLEL